MSDQKRLFFALPLPADLQQRIIEWRAASFAPDAGRPIAAANLHITLAFLGDVSAQKQRTLSTLAGRIQQPGFTLATGTSLFKSRFIQHKLPHRKLPAKPWRRQPDRVLSVTQ